MSPELCSDPDLGCTWVGILLQAKRPQLRTWLDQFGELYSKGVIAASVGLLAVLLLSGVPLLGAAGQVCSAAAPVVCYLLLLVIFACRAEAAFANTVTDFLLSIGLPGSVQRGAFYRAMGLLTVASPCALVMVPLAYVSAIAAIASRRACAACLAAEPTGLQPAVPASLSLLLPQLSCSSAADWVGGASLTLLPVSCALLQGHPGEGRPSVGCSSPLQHCGV